MVYSLSICFSYFFFFTPFLLLSLYRTMLVPFEIFTFEGGEFFLSQIFAIGLCVGWAELSSRLPECLVRTQEFVYE